MKKYLYYVAPLLIAAAAVACSQDDITEISENNASDGRQEIEFHLDMMSRASDRTIANLDTIWVYADDGSETVFEATPFIKDQYGNFKSAEKIYWPDGKENINFTAFWPSTQILNSDKNKETCNTTAGYKEENHSHLTLSPGIYSIKTEVPANAYHHYDLITATANITKENANNGIGLSFSHAFAQIEFRAKIDESAEHSVTIHSMLLSGHTRFGNYEIKNRSWTNLSSTENLYSAPTSVFTVTQEAKSLTEKTGPIYVIPKKATFATIHNNQSGVLLMVYAKVYKEGELIFPSETWNEDEKNARIPQPHSRDDINSLLNDEGCMRLRIYIGDGTFEFKA